jgi:hypothetical protein
MSWLDIKHAMRGDNNESVGTRIGLYIDPLHYLSKLWGGQKNYDAFVNKSGDFLNKQASSVVKPIDKVARKYDPLHKAVTSTDGGDEAATWIANKPATTAGVLYGAIAGGQALGGLGGGGGGSAAPVTSPTAAGGGGGMGFGGAGTGGIPQDLAGNMAGTQLGAAYNGLSLQGGAGTIGGSGLGAAQRYVANMNQMRSLGGGGGGGAGGQPQQQDLGAQANAQVGVPPHSPTMSERMMGGMDKLSQGLNPVDPRVAASMDPAYLQQLRNNAMLKMGIGMMGAAGSGGRFNQAVAAGLGSSQAGFGKDIEEAYQVGKETRAEKRAIERQDTADQRYEAETAYSHNRDDINDKRQQQILDENKRYHDAYLNNLKDRAEAKGGGADSALDPDTINLAAADVMSDPAHMRTYASYGASGQKLRSQINNRISQRLKDSGMTERDLITLRASAKSNVQNLGQLQKQYSQFSVAHDLARANGDRLLDLFSKVDDTSVPMIEGVRRAAARGVGGVDETELKSVLTAFQTEVARIIAGHPEMRGVVSDGLRHEVESMVPGNMTTAQAKRVINRLYLEMDIKMSSISDQITKATSSQYVLPGSNEDSNVIDFGSYGGGSGLGSQPFQIAPGQKGGPKTLEVDY